MAHYLAEVIARAETAKGAEKLAAERECFEVILQLWKHRASLSSPRPLESFERIFHALNRLLDHKHLVYFRRTERKLDPNSDKWLDLADSIDHAARELIRWCIAMASSEALKKDQVWLESKTACELDDGPDLQAAQMLIDKMKIFIGTEEQLAEQRAKELAEIRDRLNGLLAMSKTMRDHIDTALRDSSAKIKSQKSP